MFPHSNVDFEDAVGDCLSRSIKGCPAKLLLVENVEDVFYSMTFEDIEFCPPHLREERRRAKTEKFVPSHYKEHACVKTSSSPLSL